MCGFTAAPDARGTSGPPKNGRFSEPLLVLRPPLAVVAGVGLVLLALASPAHAQIADAGAASAPAMNDRTLPAPSPVSPTAQPVTGTVQEVIVRGRSPAQAMRESAQPVKVIETTEARRHTADTGEVLARTEGVAVQRTGGLGSGTRLSLHGLTDDQIRTYVDGIPLEAAGFGLGISTVPLGWIDRIDVYRGVVPLELGSDALGGAINLIADPRAPSPGIVGSYAGGAFDTHQLALEGRAGHAPSRLHVRAAVFHDTARNDYPVDVRIPDERGRLLPARVRRFHDGYRATGALLEAGLGDRRGDRLLLRVHATDFRKDLQHNIDMTVPYGQVAYGQRALGGSLHYQQPRLGGGPLGVTAMVAYNRRWLDFRDTSPFVHDWFGNQIFERAPGSGELSAFASDLTQTEDRVVARAALIWRLVPRWVVRLLVAPDLVTRSGAERLRINPQRIDPLTTRREIFQLVSGLEATGRDEADRFETVSFAKSYFYRPSSDQVRIFDNTVRHVEDTINRLGLGNASRLRIFRGIFAKFSYEYATRLPRPDEVFGDGALVLPNLQLGPETSHNANLGALVERGLGAGRGTLSAEVTTFLRLTRDLVVLLPAQDRNHSLHQNVLSARTTGIDGMVRWVSAERRIDLHANTTWQELRNASTGGPFAPFQGQRVPNRPWLFANLAAVLRLTGGDAGSGGVRVAWHTRYVRAFLPGWEDTSLADDRNRIPSQLTHGASLMYSLRGGPYALDVALDLSNLTDQPVYDVLGVQKPGRALFLKVTGAWSALDLPSATNTENN